jgi:UDP-glucose 4-epimerase
MVYGDGSKSRDFTYVTDAVDATVKSLTKGEGAFNIGGGTRVTVKELAERIIDLAGSGKIEYIEDQRGDVEHTASETKKARKELGWRPKTGFDEGLKETVEWIKSIYRH